MKVTFVYSDYSGFHGFWNSRRYTPSVAALSAYLKNKNIDTSLIHVSNEISLRDFVSQVKVINPDILAFTAISMTFPQIKKLASWTKIETNIPTILGGVHATLSPEASISTGSFDYICRGEGEKVLYEICVNLENKEKITGIPNIWIMHDGMIEKNMIGKLEENLDSLPIPDWDIFDIKNVVDFYHLKSIPVMASRGCPYACTYCANHALKNIYPNKEHYTRFRSVDGVIDEIKKRKQSYPWLSNVRFLDDTLSLKKNWFNEFVDKYPNRIGLPFSCNERINHLDENTVAGFKEAGCFLLEVGIESGDDEVRNKIMKRGILNDQIHNAMLLCKKYGVIVNTFNIIGVPGENILQALKTIKINAKYRPAIAKYFYFKPSPSTDLYNLCKEKDYLINKDSISLYDGPAIETNNFSAKDQIFIYEYRNYITLIYRLLGLFPERFQNKAINLIERTIASRNFPRRFLVYLIPLLIWDKLRVQNLLMKSPWLYQKTRSLKVLLIGSKPRY